LHLHDIHLVCNSQSRWGWIIVSSWVDRWRRCVTVTHTIIIFVS